MSKKSDEKKFSREDIRCHWWFVQGLREAKSLFREFYPYDDAGNHRNSIYMEMFDSWGDFGKESYAKWCVIDDTFHNEIKEQEEILKYMKDRKEGDTDE